MRGLYHGAAVKTAFSPMLQEYDIVEIRGLRQSSRAYDGTDGVMREPKVGDRGIVVHILGEDEEEMKYVVECVNPAGLTVWLADFWESELEKSDEAQQSY